jgi:hypothetical protein
MQVTFTKLVKGFEQGRHDKYVAREIRQMKRLRAKGHRDFARMTDEGIVRAAEAIARINNAGEVCRPT